MHTHHYWDSLDSVSNFTFKFCPVVQKGEFYLKELVEILAEVLHEIHIGDSVEDHVFRFLREGNFGLRKPCPMERV